PSNYQSTVALSIEFHLVDQLTECLVRHIVLGSYEHDRRVAGYFDFARLIAVIDDRQAPHLHVILRRHGDLELRLDVRIAATERDLVEIERRLEPIWLLTAGLVGGGPDTARPGIAQIDEMSASVGRGVVAPPGDRHVA